MTSSESTQVRRGAKRRTVALVAAIVAIALATGFLIVRSLRDDSAPASVAHTLLPAPQTAELTGERLPAGASQVGALADALRSWAPNAARLADELAATLPDGPASTAAAATQDATGPEDYTLTVGTDGLTLAAGGPAGAYWAVTALAQMIDPAGTVAAGRVVDSPRYRVRSVMIDVARHFHGPEQLRDLVDLATELRFNELHLHLTDDQGWRLEIPDRPRLAEVASRNDVSGGEGGYLTLAEYEDLQDYAAARHMTVVPEIDLPGHTNALLVAYPEASPDGLPREHYRGIDVGFSSVDLTSEASWDLVTDIVETVAEHTRGDRIHLGGDEAHTLSREEYATYVTRLGALAASTGKALTMWQDAYVADLPAGSRLQFWTHDGSTSAIGERVEELDLEVVASPARKAYLDMKHDDRQVLGLRWAGTIDLRTAYDWSPEKELEGIDPARIVGVETCLFTETLPTWGDVTYQLLPRLAAEASVAWGSPRDLDAFLAAADVARDRWEARGYVVHREGDVRGR
ncbi:family 20 glycosylhydrolase [Sanguibacter sp. HDW7]|uniref:family 20 glycosylhydrolase n=1 Tax=Sanguibacter sp. HDW7 TaxID=2714931 RepID=UPI001408B0A2|nr:family 20 glycosylhydrolase [Sanguibacter sp. HDW7]QIK82208.1 family 20 glycosylhydrolase [Sanguibacter sp. HDW7]